MTQDTIQIRLIRNKERAGASNDDIITVSRTYCDGVYKMVYKDTHNKTTFTTTMTKSGLLEYLDTLFSMVVHDDEPYEKVQVSFPYFPSVLIHQYDFDNEEVLANVKTAARSTFRSWRMNSIHEMWDYEDA